MIPSPTPGDLGHRWVAGLDFGAGPGKVCARCGVREGAHGSALLCNALRPNYGQPVPVRTDYDPLNAEDAPGPRIDFNPFDNPPPS